MGRIIIKNQPCDHPGCDSSDAVQIYSDYSSYCFSCLKPRPEGYWDETGPNYKKSGWRNGSLIKEDDDLVEDYDEEGEPTVAGFKAVKQPKEVEEEVEEISRDYPLRGWKERRIYKPVMEHYDVRCTLDTDGEPDAFYFPEEVVDGKVESYSQRTLPKTFKSLGEVRNSIFGLHLYTKGKRIVITEGHVDALSVQAATYKKYKRFYPAVSFGSCSSLKNIIANREKLRMFDEVVFWPDGDKQGQSIIPEVAKIIGYDKVKIVSCPYKDASEVWMKEQDPIEVLRYIWEAAPYTPASVMTAGKLWTALVEYNKLESLPYPAFMSGINEKVKGMRFGDISLFISGTGSGKSSLIREVVWHILQQTKDKVGINALEEGPAETARKLAGLALSKNPSRDEIPLEELKVGFDAVFGEDRVMVLDHQGSISDGSIMDHIEFMCLSGCKYIIIDHITILASEGAAGLTGNEAIDKIMNQLIGIAKKHNVWIGLISHLRKTGGDSKSFEEGKIPSIDDIKGSGSIKQISMDIIAFARDMTAESEEVRNTIKTKVLKCRYTGLTGPSGNLKYDYESGRLQLAPSFEDTGSGEFEKVGFKKVE